ncbi:Coenzyme PQQ synthesis protein D (PqqD) [uncultured Clostridium sp.]|nr:Coenzyme PQQ synthesis protein D (PqqD) [uncultured Clostridium sp.]
MKKFSKKNKNYLDFIPIINPKISWYVNDKNIVVLEVKRTGFFDKVAQKIFHAPPKSKIKLDKFGSFIWKCINGKKSVFEISKEVKEHFGNEAEPLLDRLITFFNILVNNKFITFNKKREI